jgi:hypothetical protein
MEPPTQSIEIYQRYIAERLCWIDGVPTHASSDLQRQCPHCRRKWSYERLGQELRLLEQYCLGSNASEAARAIDCAKNTALYHYCLFNIQMQEAVASMLLDGEIATNPVTLIELRSLEKALRAGNGKRREKTCRHLFLAGLNYEERLECLFRCHVVKAVEIKIEESKKEPGIAEHIFPSMAGTWRHERRVRTPLWRKLVGIPQSIWQNLRGRFDPQCPYPSQGCVGMGTKWVQVWSATRSMARGR